MMPRVAEIKVSLMSFPWLQDILFASANLMRAVEEEGILVSDEIKEAANELRRVVEDRT